MQCVVSSDLGVAPPEASAEAASSVAASAAVKPGSKSVASSEAMAQTEAETATSTVLRKVVAAAPANTVTEASRDGPGSAVHHVLGDDGAEEALALQDLLELQRCGLAVRWTSSLESARASSRGRLPGAG